MRKKSLSIFTSALIALGISATVAAANAPTSGLGKAWPNAQDVSASPHWHVYVFVRDGVRYIQVNDLNGGVHGAVATAGGAVLVLPMGSDQTNVVDATSPTDSVATTPATTTSSSETVYSDSSISITASTLSTGSTQLKVASVTGCDDPVECSTNIAPKP
jgi:hypothetical protein